MRRIDTSYLSTDECWSIQINGFEHCRNCKWTGISACEGKDIVRTGYNSKGYRIGDKGIEPEDYKPESDQQMKGKKEFT